MAPATSILLKLALIWVMIYYGGQVSSGLWVILLLPVISAATRFGLLGTAAFTMLACLHNASFIALVDFGPNYIPWDPGGREFSLRMVILIVVGFLVNQLAEASRRGDATFSGDRCETRNSGRAGPSIGAPRRAGTTHRRPGA